MFLFEQLAANGGSASPETQGQIIASKAIFDFITNDSISACSYNSAGTGYIVGETFDIVTTGIASPEIVEVFVARGVVVAESGGVPSEVKIISGGSLPLIASIGSPFDTPITAVATANASAGGNDGLLVDIVPEQAHWSEDRGNGAESPLASTDFVDGRTEFEWICTSLKSTNPATIGLETIGGGNPYVQLLVATGFSKTQSFFNQPGASPNAPNLMMPSNNPQIYISSSERRVNIMIRDGSFVQYGTIGFFIPFTDTEANYPFPGAAFGQTSGALTFSSGMVRGNGATPGTQNSGVINAMALQTGTAAQGPYYFRDNLSPQWLNICEATSELATLRAQMWPQAFNSTDYDFTDASVVSGFATDPTSISSSFSAGIIRENAATTSWFGSDAGGADGVQGIGPLGLGNRLSFVVQPHIIANQTGDVQIIGILDGLEAVHGRGLTAFQEIVQFNGKRYVVFPDTNTSDLFRWIAMEIV